MADYLQVHDSSHLLADCLVTVIRSRLYAQPQYLGYLYIYLYPSTIGSVMELFQSLQFPSGMVYSKHCVTSSLPIFYIHLKMHILRHCLLWLHSLFVLSEKWYCHCQTHKLFLLIILLTCVDFCFVCLSLRLSCLTR